MRFSLSRRARLRVPLALALLGAMAYVGYKFAEDPANQIWGKTIVAGPADVREIALTFDDGPNPPYTDRILDVLRREHVRATFFLVGRAVAANPATVRRIVNEGHAVGNHTWDHPHMLVLSRSAMRGELRRTDDAIFHAAGVRTRLMRPPFGARDFAVIDEAKAEGYQVVMWSVPLPKDWEMPGDAAIASRVVDHVRDGSIIVLHDGNRGLACGKPPDQPAAVCDRGQDVAATRRIIETLRDRGYRFVTIPELLADTARDAAKHIVARSTR